jgi:hypothetical protein
VLAALAVAGQRRATRFGRFVLWAPVVAVLLTAVVFYGGHRVRTAMEPSVVLGAALAVVALVERRIGPAAGPTAETESESPSSPEPEVTSTSALTAT